MIWTLTSLRMCPSTFRSIKLYHQSITIHPFYMTKPSEHSLFCPGLVLVVHCFQNYVSFHNLLQSKCYRYVEIRKYRYIVYLKAHQAAESGCDRGTHILLLVEYTALIGTRHLAIKVLYKYMRNK